MINGFKSTGGVKVEFGTVALAITVAALSGGELGIGLGTKIGVRLGEASSDASTFASTIA